MLLYIIITIWIWIIAPISTADVNILYLGSVPHLNSSTLRDHYFSCGLVGRSLHWQVNSEVLGGFEMTDVADAIVDRRSNFNYTATLLSSTPKENLALFASVLIIYSDVLQTQQFQVMCSSESNYSISNHGINVTGVQDQNRTVPSIPFDYVLSKKILQDNITHIFVCSTPDQYQFLEVNESQIGFNGHDRIGQNKSIFSRDYRAVIQQAVLLDRHLATTTVFFVSYNSTFTVSCSSGPQYVKFNVNNVAQRSSTNPDTITLPTPSEESAQSDSAYITTLPTPSEESAQSDLVKSGHSTVDSAIGSINDLVDGGHLTRPSIIMSSLLLTLSIISK